MSRFGVSKFLFNFNQDPDLRHRYKSDPQAALSTFSLTDDERAALAGHDFRTLYSQGIHPLLLTALANGLGVPIPQYLKEIRGQA